MTRFYPRCFLIETLTAFVINRSLCYRKCSQNARLIAYLCLMFSLEVFTERNSDWLNLQALKSVKGKTLLSGFRCVLRPLSKSFFVTFSWNWKVFFTSTLFFRGDMKKEKKKWKDGIFTEETREKTFLY